MKTCHYCNSQWDDHYSFCIKCGHKLQPDLKCPHCGGAIEEGDSFCNNCGKEIGVIKAEKADQVIVNKKDNGTQCPFCGTTLEPGTKYCIKCGKPQSLGIPSPSNTSRRYDATPVETRNKYQPSSPIVSEPPKKGDNGIFVVLGVSLFIVIAALAGGYYYHDIYLPEKLEREAELERMAEEHRRDSLDQALWSETMKKGTERAFRKYLREYPNGIYSGEATSKLDHFQKLKLTEDEVYYVTNCLKTFLSSLANNEENDMLECLYPEMESFMGKSNATKVDAVTYIKKLHSEDIYDVQIIIGDIEVSKTLDEQDVPIYAALFTYDRRLSREDTSLETFASFKGRATFNNAFRIVSITQQKTSHY